MGSSTRAFERGASLLPPGVGTVFFASQFDCQMMEPLWLIGVFKGFDAKAKLSAAAARVGGEEETLVGRTGTQRSGDLYGVLIDSKTIGVHAPSNRQAVAKWLNHADSIELQFRELEEFLKRHRDASPTAYARWFDRYATRIDSMSITGVDSDAVDFAAMMAREFRNVSLVLTRTAGTINSRTIAEREYGSQYFYGDHAGIAQQLAADIDFNRPGHKNTAQAEPHFD